MRQVKERKAKNGTVKYQVRFRSGGVQRSETFHKKQDAKDFASVMDGGGVASALLWLDARKTSEATLTYAEYLPHYVEQLTGVTPRTRAEYGAQSRRYLASINDMPLPLITKSHVAAIVNQMEAAGRAPKTIKNLVHSLSSVMALALEEGHITKNPCRKVRLPDQSLEEQEPRFLTPEEFALLYDAIDDHYKPLVAFLVGTGMRWSEATAVEARHVDLANGTVRVSQAWKWAGAGLGWRIGVPKSKKSRRTVNAAVLALAAVRPKLGKPGDLVFTTPTGKAVRHNNFYNRVWVPAIKKAGLEGTRIHHLRHTHASWLISDGQSLEAVQDQLGHESILTTRKVYGHLLPAIGVAVGKSASEALARALPQAAELGVHVLALEPVQGPE